MKTLQGKIVISRSSGRPNDRPFTIRLEDTLSGCIVVEIEMTHQEFADAITAHYTTCQFDFNDSGAVGMKLETKTEVVKFKGGWDDRKDKREAMKALKPFEVDGWEGRVSDLFNVHNWVGGKSDLYRVSFHRHVPVEQPPTKTGDCGV